ncbi:MAG: PDZ domain-containing protein [Planctomycetia bacterium]|nr:PDZ domain-containing protein [Planctomycetia bacterium]
MLRLTRKQVGPLFTWLAMASCSSLAWAAEPAPPPVPVPPPAPGNVIILQGQATAPAAGVQMVPGVPAGVINVQSVAQPVGQVQPGFGVVTAQAFTLPLGEQGKFWLGIMSQPAPEVLREQLALPAGTGLVVHDVLPEGPAAKAGLKRNDVLLTADGKPLADVAALSKIVNQPGAKEFELSILRAGKPQTVKITPAERPMPDFVKFAPQGADRKAVEEWADQLRRMAGEGQRVGPGHPLRLRILHAGQAILQAQAELEKPFPVDLSVSITREGNKPAKISVKQGDKSWQIGVDEMAKLPDTVRPFVAGMMRNLAAGQNTGPASFTIGTVGGPNPVGAVEAVQVPEVEITEPAIEGPRGVVPPPPPAIVPGVPPQPGHALIAPPAAPDVHRDIKQLRDQLQQLQDRLDKLGGESERKK